MNAKLASTTLIVLSSLIAGTSFAGNADSLPQVGDYDVVRVSPAASSLSREAVKAEVLAARVAGELPQVGDVDVAYDTATPSGLTRQAVKAEYLTARKADALPRSGEQS